MEATLVYSGFYRENGKNGNYRDNRVCIYIYIEV